MTCFFSAVAGLPGDADITEVFGRRPQASVQPHTPTCTPLSHVCPPMYRTSEGLTLSEDPTKWGRKTWTRRLRAAQGKQSRIRGPVPSIVRPAWNLEIRAGKDRSNSIGSRLTPRFENQIPSKFTATVTHRPHNCPVNTQPRHKHCHRQSGPVPRPQCSIC